MTVTMRLKEQEAHQGIYSDKQWQVRPCGPRPQCLAASQAQTWLSPRTSSAGATVHSLWLRGTEHRVWNGAGMNNGRGGSAEGTVLGMDWGICSSA